MIIFVDSNQVIFASDLSPTLACNMVIDVRNQYAERSWDVFNNYLEKTPPLNGICSLLKLMSLISSILCILLLDGFLKAINLETLLYHVQSMNCILYWEV